MATLSWDSPGEWEVDGVPMWPSYSSICSFGKKARSSPTILPKKNKKKTGQHTVVFFWGETLSRGNWQPFSRMDPVQKETREKHLVLLKFVPAVLRSYFVWK